MTIAGRIPYPAGPLAFPCPTGMEFTVAVDGTYHVMAATGGADFALFANANTLTANATTVTNAQFRTDIAAQLGLVDGSDGSQIIAAVIRIPCPGTSKFIIMGQSFSASQGQYEVYGIRYSVTASGTVVVDGKYHFLQGGLNPGWLGGDGTSGCLGAAVIGNFVYWVAGFGNFFSGFEEFLVKLTIVGNDVDVTLNSWLNHLYDLPAEMAAVLWWTESSGDKKNWATVFEHEDGIGVIANRAIIGSPSVLYLTVVDTSISAPGTNTGQNDISATFGMPFADEGFNFVGSPTAFGDDLYCNPIVIDLGGGLLEWHFPRGYSDVDGEVGDRRFITNHAIEEIQAFDLQQFLLNPDTGLTLESVHVYRISSDEVVFMIREDAALTFGTFELTVTPPSPPTPGGGGGSPYFIERMDNRIWPTIEDAWCLDAALELEQPEPDALLAVSSAAGDGAIRSYSIINGGSGYTAPIGQVFDLGGPGSGATVTLSVSSGIIVTATAVAIGSAYKSPSQLAILDTTGTGAVIQPLVTNYTTLSTNTSSFTASDVGSIVRVGGGRIEIVTVSSTTSAIGNVLAPITNTVPNDPDNTPVTAVSGQWSMTAPVTTVSGLWHLEGLTVAALADGGVVTGLTVSSGSVTLPISASQVLVGLPFTAQLQTMNLDAGAGPTVQSRRKDITQTVLRVENSRAPEVGLNQPDAAAQPNQAEIPWGGVPYTAMTQVKDRTPAMFAGTAIPLFSGDLEITNLFSTWDARGQIAVQQTNPLPLTITALIPWVKVGDTPGQ